MKGMKDIRDMRKSIRDKENIVENIVIHNDK